MLTCLYTSQVLQGGITTCAEPYMKLGDAVKSTQRILQQVPLLCSRLGTYHMAFAWAARSDIPTIFRLSISYVTYHMPFAWAAWSDIPTIFRLSISYVTYHMPFAWAARSDIPTIFRLSVSYVTYHMPFAWAARSDIPIVY